ncbi:thioesterase family protein [Streptomyces sp. NPDC047071]|uniref:thioesterase family protein n=1 Tax=Streptomyces sp. NPDC047071 TaxID=3154808 RepID=UPI0034551875
MTGEVRHDLPLYRRVVPPEWIDHDGHLSEAHYSVAFGSATDSLMEATGLHADYRAATGATLWTVEAHVRLLRQVAEGAHLVIRSRVLGSFARRLHFAHEMYLVEGPGAAPAPDAEPVATCELLALHVDRERGRSVPFPEPVRERHEGLVEQPPPWAGRAVGAPPR